MAVDLTKNPWVIAAADAGATLLTSLRIRVKKIRWIGATTAGHTVVLRDKNARQVWASVCPLTAAAGTTAAPEEVQDPGGQSFEWDGLIAATIGSGTVYIYYA